MATPAREYHQCMVHFLRKDFTYADNGTSLEMGVIPAGSLILKPISGVNVSTAFNDSGTDKVDIGTSGTADLFATDLDVSSAGFIPCDEAVSFYVAAETTIKMRYDGQNSNASAGVGQAVLAFIPDIDR